MFPMNNTDFKLSKKKKKRQSESPTETWVIKFHNWYYIRWVSFFFFTFSKDTQGTISLKLLKSKRLLYGENGTMSFNIHLWWASTVTHGWISEQLFNTENPLRLKWLKSTKSNKLDNMITQWLILPSSMSILCQALCHMLCCDNQGRHGPCIMVFKVWWRKDISQTKKLSK